MTDFYKDRKITPEINFNGAEQITFEACTFRIDTEIDKITNEKVRRAVEHALQNAPIINEGRDYVLLNGTYS